ncbi:alpha/beta hydrolase [Paenibacillus filicis]|uniref:Alpha/beta hydrolase n=1 Tax=Paenibacillus gyeongsangnamensis TaxID=3388067 RepID=A0ABT4QD79_9BACL|nr:alpha/beta hydrolase [Paenibacillus filicis]MCZ8514815.1 alpha/beta hydrolase [Paenibacillus filicis]
MIDFAAFPEGKCFVRVEWNEKLISFKGDGYGFCCNRAKRHVYRQGRGGAELPYRHYEGNSDKVLVFLHVISEPSLYLRIFGEAVACAGLATVYLPDLRGYGTNPAKRGHIDYMGQLDDDLEDLIVHIRQAHPDARVILGGHSAAA